MNCKQLQAGFVEFILGELPAEQGKEIQMHLNTGCGECTHEFQVVNESIESLLSCVPTEDLSKGEINAIVNRATQDQFNKTEFTEWNPETIATDNLLPFKILQAALATAAGFAMAIFVWPGESPKPLGADPFAVLGQQRGSIGPEVDSTTSISLITSRTAEPTKKNVGYLIFDQLRNELHFLITGLDRLPDNQVYVLWIQTAQGYIPQVIDVDDHGRYRSALVELNDRQISSIFVTQELRSQLLENKTDAAPNFSSDS